MTQQIPERIPGGAVDLSHLAARANAPRPDTRGAAPQGQVVEVPALVLDVTDQTFEQVAQLSAVVPVVIDLWAEWCQPCKTLSPVLEKVTHELGGRVLLVKVDVDANPGLAQAFQAQSIPTVVALVGGRPLPLFQGAVPEAQVRELFGQLVQLAEQQGVVGRVSAPDAAPGGEDAPVEPPVNPAHADALDALERGDYAAAVEAYEQVLLQAPQTRRRARRWCRCGCCIASRVRARMRSGQRRRRIRPMRRRSCASPTSTSRAAISRMPSCACWSSSPRAETRTRAPRSVNAWWSCSRSSEWRIPG